MPDSMTARLAAAGITLLPAPAPVAAYVGYVVHNNIVTVSGQLPFVDGTLTTTGLLGDTVDADSGYQAARICAINLLSQVAAACGGDLERVQRCIRLGGFVASTAQFTDQPKVINGASELIGEMLGEKGAHARAAVGVAALPMNACVEVEGMFAIS